MLSSVCHSPDACCHWSVTHRSSCCHQSVTPFAGLDPSSCLQKMKLLALVSLASSSSEIDFSQVERELQIESSAVEQTVVDGVSVCLCPAHIHMIWFVSHCKCNSDNTSDMCVWAGRWACVRVGVHRLVHWSECSSPSPSQPCGSNWSVLRWTRSTVRCSSGEPTLTLTTHSTHIAKSFPVSHSSPLLLSPPPLPSFPSPPLPFSPLPSPPLPSS